MWKNEAIAQMVAHKIPASITLAQGILESGYGNSELARYGNNHFGIKCHDWKGETMLKDDDHKDDCFRKYETANESFDDHSKFLAKRGRYSSLFDLKTTDYKGWAKGLKKAGYATNPKYANLLIDLIEENELYKYDAMFAVASNKEVAKPAPVSGEIAVVKPQTYIHATKQSSNNIKYVEVGPGDTFYKIAKEFDMGLWQLYKYNDLSKADILQIGDRIYLQPKRNKNKAKEHVARSGQTMRDISQLYGIKLKKLYKRNTIIKGEQPVKGQVVLL